MTVERDGMKTAPESAAPRRSVRTPWLFLGAGAGALALSAWTGREIARLARLAAAQGACGTQEAVLLFAGLAASAVAALMLAIAAPRSLRARSRRSVAISLLGGLSVLWVVLVVRLLSA